MYGKLGGVIQIKMMFLDYLYSLPNATSGLDAIAVQTISAVPWFIPLLMAFTFFLVFLGGIGRQKARSGTADYPMWSVVASLATFLLTLMITMLPITAASRDGVLGSLVVIVVVTIFSGVWLFLDRKVSEV